MKHIVRRNRSHNIYYLACMHRDKNDNVNLQRNVVVLFIQDSCINYLFLFAVALFPCDIKVNLHVTAPLIHPFLNAEK